MLISNRGDFRVRKVIRDEKGCHIMIKESVLRRPNNPSCVRM